MGRVCAQGRQHHLLLLLDLMALCVHAHVVFQTQCFVEQ